MTTHAMQKKARASATKTEKLWKVMTWVVGLDEVLRGGLTISRTGSVAVVSAPTTIFGNLKNMDRILVVQGLAGGQ